MSFITTSIESNRRVFVDTVKIYLAKNDVDGLPKELKITYVTYLYNYLAKNITQFIEDSSNMDKPHKRGAHKFMLTSYFKMFELEESYNNMENKSTFLKEIVDNFHNAFNEAKTVYEPLIKKLSAYELNKVLSLSSFSSKDIKILQNIVSHKLTNYIEAGVCNYNNNTTRRYPKRNIKKVDYTGMDMSNGITCCEDTIANIDWGKSYNEIIKVTDKQRFYESQDPDYLPENEKNERRKYINMYKKFQQMSKTNNEATRYAGPIAMTTQPLRRSTRLATK